MNHKRYFTFNDFQIINIITGEEWKENCYIVSHRKTKEQFIIDPGYDVAEEIIKEIQKMEGDLIKIILTHAHHDHIGDVSKLCKKTNVKCMLHKKDYKLFKHAPLFSRRIANRKLEIPDDKDIELYDDGFILKIAGKNVELIHTPGHSAGSVCIMVDGFIFTGDTLFFKSIGRTDLPGGSEDELLSSISKLDEIIACGTEVFPGHGHNFKYDEVKEWMQQGRGSFEQWNRYRIIGE